MAGVVLVSGASSRLGRSIALELADRGWEGAIVARRNRRSPLFLLRFDMRCPEWGDASSAELNAAGMEISRYAEKHGAAAIVVSERHRSTDRRLPWLLVLASAIAAATESIAIQVGALLLLLHDPVRIAEGRVLHV